MSRRLVIVPLVVLLAAAPARAVSWSMGTQFGIASITSGGDAGKSTVVGWPASAITYQPGLRVAAGNARHTRDVTLDSGLFLLDEAGSTLSLFTATLAYQHVVKPEWPWSPFGNIGLGFGSANPLPSMTLRKTSACRRARSASVSPSAGP